MAKVHSPRNPLDPEEGWLDGFITQAHDEWRQTWAGMISQGLDHMQPQAVVPLWDHWLQRYWSKRLQGLPAPLSPTEAAVMVEWVIPLEPVLEPVAGFICRMHLRPLRNWRILHSIREVEVAKRQPMAVSSLMRALLEAIEPPFYACDEAVAVVRDPIPTSSPRETLLAMCDSLARLGCAAASELRGQISERNA